MKKYKYLKRIVYVGIPLVSIFIIAALLWWLSQNTRIQSQVITQQYKVQDDIFEMISCDLPDKISDSLLYKKIKYPVSGLSDTFMPEGLVAFDVQYLNNPQETILADQDAINAFVAMSEKAAQEGVFIRVNSGFRSYARQKSIYENPINNIPGQPDLAARPGYSEHQLGTTIDVSAPLTSARSILFSTYDWMERNGPSFGFIHTFPRGSEEITGFRYEPWHIRYVEPEVAMKIYENKIIFNEIDDVFIKTETGLYNHSLYGDSFTTFALSREGERTELLTGPSVFITESEIQQALDTLTVQNIDVTNITVRGETYTVRAQEQSLFGGSLVTIGNEKDVERIDEFVSSACKVIQ